MHWQKGRRQTVLQKKVDEETPDNEKSDGQKFDYKQSDSKKMTFKCYRAKVWLLKFQRWIILKNQRHKVQFKRKILQQQEVWKKSVKVQNQTTKILLKIWLKKLRQVVRQQKHSGWEVL